MEPRHSHDPAPGAGRIIRTVARHPSATLLVVQLLGVLIYPFIEGDRTTNGTSPGKAFLGVFGIVVLFLAVRAVRSTPSLNVIAVVLGVPVLVMTIVEAIVPDNDAVVVASSLLLTAFYFATAYALIVYMFSDTRVTSDELWATGAAFTVIAWGFAYLYAATQVIWPGSFTAAIDSELPRTWMEMLFLSFTTLTSTGLSDIVPIRAHARSFMMIEQVAGMMYLALVVARLTGLAIGRAKDENAT